MLEFKNTVVVVVFIFLKHNGLYVRLEDLNYFYRHESILCTNFLIRSNAVWVHVTCTFVSVHAICEGLLASSLKFYPTPFSTL